MELSFRWRNFDFSPRVRNLRAPTRFCRRPCRVQKFRSRLLRDSIFSDRRRVKFSAQCIRAFLPGTPVRLRNPELSRMVLRAVDWLWTHAAGGHAAADSALYRFPARAAHMVDLGDGHSSYRRNRACL